MADYLTAALVEQFVGKGVLIQLTDDGPNPTGNVNTGVLDQIIKVAEGEVNSRLYKGFHGPITVGDHGQSAYDAVQSLALICFRYHLYMRRPNLMTQAYVDAHTAALDDMDQMAKGAQALPGPVTRDSAEAPATTHSTVATRTSANRPTTRKWTRKSQGNA